MIKLTDYDQQAFAAALDAVTFKRVGGALDSEAARTVIKAAALFVLNNIPDEAAAWAAKCLKLWQELPCVPQLPELEEPQADAFWQVLMRWDCSAAIAECIDVRDDLEGEITAEGSEWLYHALFLAVVCALSFRDGVYKGSPPLDNSMADALKTHIAACLTELRHFQPQAEPAGAFYDVNKLQQKLKAARALVGEQPSAMLDEKLLARRFKAAYGKNSSGMLYFRQFGNLLIWQRLGPFLDKAMQAGRLDERAPFAADINWKKRRRYPCSLAGVPDEYADLAEACAQECADLFDKGIKKWRTFKDHDDFIAQFPRILETYFTLKKYGGCTLWPSPNHE